VVGREGGTESLEEERRRRRRREGQA